MAKKGGNGNGINKLMGQMQQQNTILQGQVINTQLSLTGAQLVSLTSQQGLTTIAIAGNNSHALMASHGAANLMKF